MYCMCVCMARSCEPFDLLKQESATEYGPVFSDLKTCIFSTLLYKFSVVLQFCAKQSDCPARSEARVRDFIKTLLSFVSTLAG